MFIIINNSLKSKLQSASGENFCL